MATTRSKRPSTTQRAPRKPSEKAQAQLIADVVASALATSAAATQAAATVAAQAVVKEFINGPGLTQVIGATVGATLERLGLDTKHAEETRRDMVHLRQWREVTENMRKQGFGEATKWVVRATLAALAVGAGVMLQRGLS